MFIFFFHFQPLIHTLDYFIFQAISYQQFIILQYSIRSSFLFSKNCHGNHIVINWVGHPSLIRENMNQIFFRQKKNGSFRLLFLIFVLMNLSSSFFQHLKNKLIDILFQINSQAFMFYLLLSSLELIDKVLHLLDCPRLILSAFYFTLIYALQAI